MKQVKCTFRLAKITPGALQYKQVDQDDAPVDQSADAKLIGTLYVRKAQMDGAPDQIQVVVSY